MKFTKYDTSGQLISTTNVPPENMTLPKVNKYTVEFIANGELQVTGRLEPEAIQRITKIIKKFIKEDYELQQ